MKTPSFTSGETSALFRISTSLLTLVPIAAELVALLFIQPWARSFLFQSGKRAKLITRLQRVIVASSCPPTSSKVKTAVCSERRRSNKLAPSWVTTWSGP